MHAVILNLFQDLRASIAKKLIVITAICYLYSINSFSQTIIGGPVIGAVTNHSARIAIMTDTSGLSVIMDTLKFYHEEEMLQEQGIVVIYLNGLEAIKKLYVSDFHLYDIIKNNPLYQKEIIYPFKRSINLIEFDSLLPNSEYIYEVELQSISNEFTTNQISFAGSFKTFPSPNDTTHFSFTLGSCTEQHHNDSIFVEMQKHKPAFFLHLGDWLYPDNFKDDKFYYDESLERQAELYQKRYDMPNLKSFLQTTPIDFVFDDEDGVCDDFSTYSYCETEQKNNITTISEILYPDSLRKMAIKGLHTFFPGYIEKEDQAYHSFVYGNCEVFFLDTRTTRSPNSEVFSKKGNYYKYNVPNGHAILNTEQMNWLLNGLKNSKAQWKFIVSGVTFNKSYKKVLDIMMLKKVQNRKLPNGMTGAYVAGSLASMWFAFPETQVQLLNFCSTNQIKNVIVLSGDAHTAAIDNGSNSGFPELMAGGLAQRNSKLASIIKNNLQLNLWNQGGQGISNTNFNDAFGKVEVNGNSSVKLSCIDKYGKEICQYVVKDGFIPQNYSFKKNQKISFGNKIKAAKQALKIKQNLQH